MKKAFLLLLLVGITFLGCNDNLDNTIAPAPSSTELDKLIGSQLFTSKLINGEIGGWVTVSQTYVNGAGNQSYVYARLRFLPGSFQGTENIEMVFDFEDVSVQFFPEMSFNRDVKLDLWFQGTDLQSLGYSTSGNVDFVYFDDNGNIELIENNYSKVNLSQNKIKVLNAELSHFSRYGWIR
jgi:hypothetical protein